jgi:hypothetical protein
MIIQLCIPICWTLGTGKINGRILFESNPDCEHHNFIVRDVCGLVNKNRVFLVRQFLIQLISKPLANDILYEASTLGPMETAISPHRSRSTVLDNLAHMVHSRYTGMAHHTDCKLDLSLLDCGALFCRQKIPDRL